MDPHIPQPLPCIEWDVAMRALAGQVVSGDQYLGKPFVNGVLVAVIDGLGHGEDAAAAANLASRSWHVTRGNLSSRWCSAVTKG
jgi:hypothetical protein